MGKRVEEGEALRSTKIRNSSPRFRRLFFYTGFRGHLHGGSGTYCCCRQRLASNRAGRSEAGGGLRHGTACLDGRGWVHWQHSAPLHTASQPPFTCNTVGV